MKRILLIISALVLGATALHAQEAEEVHAPLDSTLLGKNILSNFFKADTEKNNTIRI